MASKLRSLTAALTLLIEGGNHKEVRVRNVCLPEVIDYRIA